MVIKCKVDRKGNGSLLELHSSKDRDLISAINKIVQYELINDQVLLASFSSLFKERNELHIEVENELIEIIHEKLHRIAFDDEEAVQLFSGTEKKDFRCEIKKALDISKQMFLHMIVHKRYNLILEAFLRCEPYIDIEQQDKKGDTALHIAAQFGNDFAVMSLYRYGANIDKLNLQKQRPIHIAIKYGNTSTALLLIHLGCKLNDNKDSSILESAIFHENFVVVKAISDKLSCKTLEFPVGTRVLAAYSKGWAKGIITQHWYSNSNWERGRLASYQIKLDTGELIFSNKETDNNVVLDEEERCAPMSVEKFGCDECKRRHIGVCGLVRNILMCDIN